MTDVPPGFGAPAADDDPYVPSGARRSTFTPPSGVPAQGSGEAPVDDDALAAALAAEVAAYTAPVSIIPPVEPLAPPTPDPIAESRTPDPVVEAPTPDPVMEPPVQPVASPTLEAIERLESELRRRAEEARVPVDAPPPAPAEPLPPDATLFPPPPTFLHPAAPDQDAPLPPPTAAPPAAPPPTEPPAWAPSAFGGAEPPRPAEPPTLAEPPVAAEPPILTEPPTLAEPPVAAEPPTLVEPPASVPPPLVEPPASGTGAIDVAPFAAPPVTAPVDLPPPPSAGDFAHLPPPVGLEPAPIPPFEIHDAPPPDPADTVADSAPAPVDAVLDDDAVDDVDRMFGTGAIVVDATGAVQVISPPSEPIPTVRLADDEPGLVDEQPESHPVLLVEAAGPEPTPLDLRAGRAARMFWLWFAVNSSVVSLSLGAVLFGMGMSLRQAIVAVLIGVVVSCLPLSVVTLAGKRSGQPTMIVSRATFGIVGNGVPAVVALISRIFWGGALLWVLATGVAQVLVDSGLDAGLGAQVWTLVGLGGGFVLAFVVAIFGYGMLARLHLVLSILTAVLVVGVVVLTVPRLDLAAAQTIADGPWLLLVPGVVLVFSVVGLAWVHSAADVARYQRTESDGGATALWATFGATLPALILVGWGAMLAASDPLIADGLVTNPLYTIAALLPLWYPAPLIAALALGLISGIVLTIYSAGFVVQSFGLTARRSATTAIAGVLVLGVAAALVFVVSDARSLIVDVATTIAVPVAAWAGIFGAEVMLRRGRVDPASLLRTGGVYPAVRWVNVVAFLAVSAIGLGLTSAAVPGLTWQGYLLPYLGLGDPLLTSDVGVLVAFVLGLLLTLATAVPAIRRQEAGDRATADQSDALVD